MNTPIGTSTAMPCARCGYDLRGRPAPPSAAPECGWQQIAGDWYSTIPWVHRGAKGPWGGPLRAYFATLWRVLRHPIALGREARQRVALRQARAFPRHSTLL